MEGANGSLGCSSGVGGSSGASNDENTVSKAHEVNIYQLDLSSEESSCAVETELELELGLSLGSGVKYSTWGDHGRILMAKDFPSSISQGVSSSSSSSRLSIKAPTSVGGGIKRAANSISPDGGSPPAVRTGSSQVVGWPPIRTYRINSLVNQAKNQRAEEVTEQLTDCKGVSNKIHELDGKNKSCIDLEKGPLGFVKVYMDGVVIGRKVDLNAHSCYETLALMLEDMFFKSTGLSGDDTPKSSKLLNGSSEFVLTYEDKEGDWMLVGDVPWGMFLSSVKKLRIMRTSEAKGFAPRCPRNERNGIKAT